MIKDYLKYNGEQVVLSYHPGVTSYGQEGSEGNTGDIGPSVYYTSYCLSNISEFNECTDKMRSGKLLSNNIKEDSYNKYLPGDLIIDSIGNVYNIQLENNILSITSNKIKTNSVATQTFYDIKLSVATSYLKSSIHNWRIENPYAVEKNSDGTYDYTTYKIYHSQIYDDYVYGNWIKFSINSIDSSKYSYTYTLVLPNGEVLSSSSSNSTYMMFVDNRYIYNCFGIYDYKIDEDTLNKLGKDLSNLILSSSDDSTGKLSTILKYTSYKDNTETKYAKLISLIVSFYISKYCTGYIEVKDDTTGKIYRYDVNEIDVNSDDDSINDIVDYNAEVQWTENEDSINNDNQYPPIIPPEQQDGKTIVHRTFKNFIVYESTIEENEETNDLESEDGFIQHFYFIDIDGICDRDPRPIEFRPARRIVDVWKESIAPESGDTYLQVNKKNTLRLYFKHLNNVSITIRFNKFNNGQTDVYPKSMVYVGFPNIPLHPVPDENGDVYLEKSANIDEDGKILPDGKEGIYYIQKFIPFGEILNDSTNTATVATAGSAVFTLDSSVFGLISNEYNYIEFGVSAFGELLNSEHRPSIYNIPQGADVTDPLKYTDIEALYAGGDYYTFNNKENAGDPDVSLFVSVVKSINDNITNEEIIAENTESADETEELVIKSDKIDYKELGLKIDNLTYTKD